VRNDPPAVADAVERYARRYRQPRDNPQRVVLEIAVDRILGNA
jgi:F420H(2)-dependent biliverdin reductase